MPKATLRDVAAHAGVSVATASMVLNGRSGRIGAETQARVRAAAEVVGYQKDRAGFALRTGTGSYLCILTPARPLPPGSRSVLLDGPFFADFVAGVESAASAHGLDLAFYRVTDGGHAAQIVGARRPVGALVLGTMPESARERLAAWEVPTLVVDDPDLCATLGARHPAVTDYSVDDEGMAGLAMEHLLRLGHRRFVLLFGRLEASPVHRRRHQGALACAQRHGVSGADIDLIETDVSFAGGHAQGPRLIDALRGGATAILAMADVLAIGCHAALSRSGIGIPAAASLCGMDGLSLLDYLPYRLTTVSQNIVERGARAVELLIGAPAPSPPALSLLPGETCAPPRVG